jgi:hypothetical protein
MQATFLQRAGRNNPFEEAVFVVQHDQNSRTFKARISSKFDVSLAYKYPSYLFKNIATTTVGLHGSDLQNDKRTFRGGVQIEFNV